MEMWVPPPPPSSVFSSTGDPQGLEVGGWREGFSLDDLLLSMPGRLHPLTCPSVSPRGAWTSSPSQTSVVCVVFSSLAAVGPFPWKENLKFPLPWVLLFSTLE